MTAPKSKPVDPKPPGYTRSAWDVDLITAAIDRLDAVAARHENLWGPGRLRLLVDDELRAKFDRQTKRVNSLIWSDDQPARDVVPHIDGLARGWAVLDQAARAAGHQPLPPDVWEVRTDDGRVFAICRDNADAWLAGIAAKGEGRALAVYTIAEVARLLGAYPDVARVKAAFPGALVERAQIASDLPPMDWAVGDALPI